MPSVQDSRIFGTFVGELAAPKNERNLSGFSLNAVETFPVQIRHLTLPGSTDLTSSDPCAQNH